MPLYLSVPLPGPFRYTKRIGLLPHRSLRRKRGPYWTQPWFWITGAFVFVVAWWELVFAFYLVYGTVWCIVWAVRWLVTIALVGPAEARRTRRDDKIHKARLQAQGEDW